MSMLGSFKEEFEKIEVEFDAQLQHMRRKSASKSSTEIVIFGAGVVGHSVAMSMGDGINNLVAFCDNQKTGFNERFQIPIITPDQLINEHSDAQLIIACSAEYNDEIYNQVVKMGFDPERISRYYSGYELYDIDHLKAHYEGYRWAYDFFNDDISKQIILDRIRNYLSYRKMEHSPAEDQYFDSDVIQLSENEVFADGGFYIGDTSLEFIKRVNGCYDAIYGFEPDLTNLEAARANLAQHERAHIIDKGLWDKDETLSFFPEGASSKVDRSGTVTISLTSLDEFFSDKKGLPTFIKLDVEGAEKRALMGAEKIIRVAHPKLAICVYHKPEDIYELPQLIMQFDPSYRFTLRHYTPGMWETVLYAI